MDVLKSVLRWTKGVVSGADGLKKIIAAVTGVVIVVVGKTGLVLPPDATQEIVAVIIAYLIGQGFADAGKEAVRVQDQVAE